MSRQILAATFAAMITFGFCVQVNAQATRTWVSGVGDDVNPCSRTAPCKTFPGAISKTAAGGEISVLDPGGFGTLTITKSITINGDGNLASVMNSGTNGFTINSLDPAAVVILRNISINGAGTGLYGIRFLAGATLIVENVSISGFTVAGIDVTHAGTGNLVVRDTNITGGMAGVKISTGTVKASLSNVSIRGSGIGVDAVTGIVDVNNSVIAQNTGYGALAEGGAIDLESCMLTGNAVAVQAQAASTIRVSNSDIFNNLTGFGCGTGTIASALNNRKANNSGGSGAACAPNAMITVQ